MWCRAWRFNCILLVYFKRWCQLVMRDLIKHDVLLWLVVFQQLWLVHFDPCCFTQWFAPSAVRLSAHGSPVVVFWLWASTLLQFLFHHPCWCCYGEVLNELPLWGSRSINEVKFNDLIAWRRLAVCSRNVAIYITRDYVVRQTKKLIFHHDWIYCQKLNWIQRFLYWNESRFICHIAFC